MEKNHKFDAVKLHYAMDEDTVALGRSPLILFNNVQAVQYQLGTTSHGNKLLYIGIPPRNSRAAVTVARMS